MEVRLEAFQWLVLVLLAMCLFMLVATVCGYHVHRRDRRDLDRE